MKTLEKIEGLKHISVSLIFSMVGGLLGLILKIVISREYDPVVSTIYFFIVDTINISMMFLAATKDPLIKKNIDNKSIDKTYLLNFIFLLLFSLIFFILLLSFSKININLFYYILSVSGLFSFSFLIFFSNWSQSKGLLYLNERITTYQISLIILCSILYLNYHNIDFQLEFLLLFYVLSNFCVVFWIIYRLNIENSLPKFLGVIKFNELFIFFKESIVAALEFISSEGLFYAATIYVINFYQSNDAKLTFQAISKPLFLALVFIPGYSLYRTLIVKFTEFMQMKMPYKINNILYLLKKILVLSYLPIIASLFFLDKFIEILYTDKFLYSLFGFKILLLFVPVFIYNFILSAYMKSVNLHRYIFYVRLFVFLYFVFSTYFYFKFFNGVDFFIEANIAITSIFTALLLHFVLHKSNFK